MRSSIHVFFIYFGFLNFLQIKPKIPAATTDEIAMINGLDEGRMSENLVF